MKQPYYTPTVPWRLFVPRRKYFAGIRIVKACPELEPMIDRAAFLSLAQFVRIALLLPLTVALAVVGIAFLMAAAVVFLPLFYVWYKLVDGYDVTDKRRQAVHHGVSMLKADPDLHARYENAA